MRQCIATVSLGGTLTEKLKAIAAAGFDGIELLDDDLRHSEMKPAEVALRCRDLGLSIELYQPFRQAEGVSEREFADVRIRFIRDLEIIKALGADSILVVSNTSPNADPCEEVSAEQLHILADLGAAQGVSVKFEALAWGTHISTATSSWNVVNQADHPNLSVVIDTFHSLAREEGPEHWSQIPTGTIGFVQISDAPLMPLSAKEWSRNYRCFPSEGDFDLVKSLQAIQACGYQGPLSLEVFNPGYRQRSPAEIAQRGADALQQLIERSAVPCSS